MRALKTAMPPGEEIDMKPIAIIFCFVFNFIQVAALPEIVSKHDARIGYGFISDRQIMAAFANTYRTITSGISGEPLSSNYKSAGPLVLTHKYFISKRISVGPELNFLQLKIIERYTSGHVLTDKFFIANLSARFDIHYGRHENVKFYSGLAVGGTLIAYNTSEPAEDNKVAPCLSYQLNFFGVRVGRTWGGYAEFGFGRNGLLNVGFSRKF
jgi:hypothetical protein